MKSEHPQPMLSSALEDYLETIFELVRDHKLARVKDIAKERQVRSASVTPAMRRLSEMGLINYVQREYIDLTPEGERQARRVYARHKVLNRFFTDVIGVPKDTALTDACAMEHSLSDVTMDHVVRFFEFLVACPEGTQLLQKFHGCSLVHADVPECETRCYQEEARGGGKEVFMSVQDLRPGTRGRVMRIEGSGPIRQRLLDMGIMPDVVIEMERVSPTGDPVWVKFQGTQLSLRRREAASVVVVGE